MSLLECLDVPAVFWSRVALRDNEYNYVVKPNDPDSTLLLLLLALLAANNAWKPMAMAVPNTIARYSTL